MTRASKPLCAYTLREVARQLVAEAQRTATCSGMVLDREGAALTKQANVLREQAAAIDRTQATGLTRIERSKRRGRKP